MLRHTINKHLMHTNSENTQCGMNREDATIHRKNKKYGIRDEQDGHRSHKKISGQNKCILIGLVKVVDS